MRSRCALGLQRLHLEESGPRVPRYDQHSFRDVVNASLAALYAYAVVQQNNSTDREFKFDT